ncbi:MAG TPA: SLC13 family permease [Chlamydiales bacterium]|nr:SLC13 family permease [Chlamydiales bacterium]
MYDILYTPTTLLVLLFCIGYALIIFESFVDINKATTATVVGSLLWVLLVLLPGFESKESLALLQTHFSTIAQFLFFLWGAMIIVEIMNAHHSLELVSRCLRVPSKRLRLWLVGISTFFLSAVLDNLTTTIVMISIMKKLCDDPMERKMVGCSVVIAANAGGAWSPIGDVTTTMLWIGGQVTAVGLVKALFLPSFACLVTALLFFSKNVHGVDESTHAIKKETNWKSYLMIILGIGSFCAVPLLKIFVGLPPFIGMLLMMSFVGVCSDIMKPEENGKKLSFHDLIHRVDTSTILFFLGILLCISALESSQVLHALAAMLSNTFHYEAMIPFVIGIVSAAVDNVPIVAATMGMYPLHLYPTDSSFWHMIAYAAGVGGNMLIIGSAAGVAFMGMEKVSFS